MAETLRARPPQVRLLMGSDWPSDVQVPSKRVLCASPTQEVRDDPFCKCPAGHTFPFQGTRKYFLLGFLSFCSGALACSAFVSALAWLRPFLLARLGRPGFRSVPFWSLGCSVFALLGLAFSCLRFSSFLGFLARHMGVDE